MNPQFYVEIESVSDNEDMTSYSPARKRFCAPLDLSRRRDSVDTVKTTSSLNSNRTISPSEHCHPHARSGAHFNHSTPRNSQYSHERRLGPSPDFPYFAIEERSPYMIEAAALQRRLSTATAAGTSDAKLPRPFRAYPKDPLSTSLSTGDPETVEKFKLYRKEMLNEIMDSRGGLPTKSNPKMRRVGHKTSQIMADMEASTSKSDSSSSCAKDIAYLERREKNNAAAKKSRDRRRIKEDEIAIRATFLEKANLEYRGELASAKKEVAALTLELALVRSQLALSCALDCDME